MHLLRFQCKGTGPGGLRMPHCGRTHRVPCAPPTARPTRPRRLQNRSVSPDDDAIHAPEPRARAPSQRAPAGPVHPGLSGWPCCLRWQRRRRCRPTPQQAPNSRVILDLPDGYTPSPLVLRLPERGARRLLRHPRGPRRPVRQDGAGVLAPGARQARPHGRAPCVARALRPPHLHARPPGVGRRHLRQVLRAVSHAATRRSSCRSTCRPRTSRTAASSPRRSPSVLATATTTEKAAVRDLFSLSYLGPFKEAGTLVGTSKVYTLDGQPRARAPRRDALRLHGGALARQAPGRRAREARRRAAGEPARIQGREARRAARYQGRRPRRRRGVGRRRRRGRRQAACASIRRCCSARTAAITG